MSRQIEAGETVIDQFPVFEWDGYTKKSGETVFTTSLWKDGVSQPALPVTISEIGASGEYKVDFEPDDSGFWLLQVLIDYNKDVWKGEYDVSTGSIADIYAMVQRILGLSQENVFIDNTEFDPDGQLIASRVRIFDTKANCEAATDGGSETTGLISTYTQESVWEFINQFRTYRQVREP